MAGSKFLTSDAAASMLGVRRATLYAYVSRGLVRTASDPDDPRRQLYNPVDVDRLNKSKSLGRKPREAAARALDFGLPVLQSAITRITEDRLLYRGADACVLAETESLESVAAHLWGCDAVEVTLSRSETPGLPAAPENLPFASRAQLTLALLGANARPCDRDRVGDAVRILQTLCAIIAGPAEPEMPIHQRLATHWGCPEAADLLRRALVLAADHELNPSAFAVRIVASTGAPLASAVIAGLASISGSRHGGQIALTEDLWSRALSGGAAATIRAWLRRSERLPGFGQRLYPGADPRAEALFRVLEETPGLTSLRQAAWEAEGAYANFNLAVVALRRQFQLPQTAADELFILGRSVGWIAHAIEQAASPNAIRPRAEYIGERPV